MVWLPRQLELLKQASTTILDTPSQGKGVANSKSFTELATTLYTGMVYTSVIPSTKVVVKAASVVWPILMVKLFKAKADIPNTSKPILIILPAEKPAATSSSAVTKNCVLLPQNVE